MAAAAVSNELHAREVAEALNEVQFTGFHLRAILTAGMGFFTSAYDLTVIGTAVVLANSFWHATPLMIGLVTSISLAFTVLGAFVFGAIADRLGRKSVYGMEAILMTVGALGSALATGPLSMIIWRSIMGFGIGGDYPLSAVIMSEYANRQNRGKMVGMVFSCQALGFLAGPVVLLTMLAAGISHDLCWRIALGLGALPAAGVILLRRSMPESPRWMARARGEGWKAARQLALYSDGMLKAAGADHRVREPLRKYLLTLLGTAGAWFVLDYAYYGNTICMPLILKHLIPPHAVDPLLTSTAWNAIIFGLFAVPGYVFAFMFCDKLGHKFVQMLGFAMMALLFLIMGVVPGLVTAVAPFLILFGLSYFFVEFGPNVTTFILAAELFPVNQRTTGHGISAGMAKAGAFLGVFLFPILQSALGLSNILILSAGLSAVGLVLTAVCIKEPARKALEETSLESGWTPLPTSVPAPASVASKIPEMAAV